MHQLVGFIDAGFLRAEGARVTLGRRRAGGLRIQCAEMVAWLERQADLRGLTFLRAYWYDGAWDPDHQMYARQRDYFRIVAQTPGIQMRLEHLAERPNPQKHAVLAAVRKCGVDAARFEEHYEFRPFRNQKGVDTLLVLDLVRLAQNGAYSTAILFTGDRDIAEAVRVAQEAGCRIILAHPEGAGIAEELRHLVDELHQLTPPSWRPFFRG